MTIVLRKILFLSISFLRLFPATSRPQSHFATVILIFPSSRPPLLFPLASFALPHDRPFPPPNLNRRLNLLLNPSRSYPFPALNVFAAAIAHPPARSQLHLVQVSDTLSSLSLVPTPPTRPTHPLRSPAFTSSIPIPQFNPTHTPTIPHKPTRTHALHPLRPASLVRVCHHCQEHIRAESAGSDAADDCPLVAASAPPPNTARRPSTSILNRSHFLYSLCPLDSRSLSARLH